MRRRLSNPQRWPLVVAGSKRWSGAQRRLVVGFGALLVSAAMAVPALPTALRYALGAIGTGLIASAFWRPRRLRPSSASMHADDEGLLRVAPAGTTRILRWDVPFGVKLLASYGRPHALLAITTEAEMRYVPIRIDALSDTDDELLARIAVLSDLDFIDGVSQGGSLASHDAAALVRYAEERDRNALARVFLSGAHGERIYLDRATLSIAHWSFDLTSQLEWRPLMFHESAGQGAALYQATWIHQNDAEVVLVAPMPASIVPRETGAHREVNGRVGRALTRDLRLLQCPSEPPPARELRVAIDRPFMLAIRRALEDAPLASRAAAPAPAAPQEEGRGSLA